MPLLSSIFSLNNSPRLRDVLAFVVLIGLAFALAALGGALRRNGDRSVSLAASEYP